MIKVMIVEDSPTSREHLRLILESDPGIRVCAHAANGLLALQVLESAHPDLILMDINMPQMDGYTATGKILERYPVPIIICSSVWQPGETVMTFKAIEAGAVTALAKPPGPGHPYYQRAATNLIRTVKLMAEIKIIRHRPKTPRLADQSPPPSLLRPGQAAVELVAIGASTGGPPALKALLSVLPRTFPAPIVIVQHIADGFLEGFATWLAAEVNLTILVAEHNCPLQAATVYLVPNGTQAAVDNQRILLDANGPSLNALKPSVAHLFNSAANNYGNRAIGILLTGMGCDGAAELKMMHDQGAVTFAQDMASSVVHGMPGAAIKLQAASYILPPGQIGQALVTMIGRP